MSSPTPDEVTEKPVSEKSSLDSEVKGLAQQESTKPAETARANDAERIRSSIARLTSNSTDELEKLIAELERLQEFLKSETGACSVKSRVWWTESES